MSRDRKEQQATTTWLEKGVALAALPVAVAPICMVADHCQWHFIPLPVVTWTLADLALGECLLTTCAVFLISIGLAAGLASGRIRQLACWCAVGSALSWIIIFYFAIHGFLIKD